MWHSICIIYHKLRVFCLGQRGKKIKHGENVEANMYLINPTIAYSARLESIANCTKINRFDYIYKNIFFQIFYV